MADTIETLRERMEAAAEALDFEEAKRLRDRIGLMGGRRHGGRGGGGGYFGAGAAAARGDGAGDEPAKGRAAGRLEASAQAGPDDSRTRLPASMMA